MITPKAGRAAGEPVDDLERKAIWNVDEYTHTKQSAPRQAQVKIIKRSEPHPADSDACVASVGSPVRWVPSASSHGTAWRLAGATYPTPARLLPRNIEAHLRRVVCLGLRPFDHDSVATERDSYLDPVDDDSSLPRRAIGYLVRHLNLVV
jgi:hypothetical protein